MSLWITPNVSGSKPSATLSTTKKPISVQLLDPQNVHPLAANFKTYFQLENKSPVVFSSSMVTESHFDQDSEHRESPFREIQVENFIKKTDKERVIERVFVLDSCKQKVTFTDTYSFLESASSNQLISQREQKPQIEQSTEITNQQIQDTKFSYQTMIDTMNKRIFTQDLREQELQSQLDEQISQVNAQKAIISQMKMVQNDTEQQLLLFKNLNDQLRQQLQYFLDQNSYNNSQNSHINNTNEDKNDAEVNNNSHSQIQDVVGTLHSYPNIQSNLLESAMNDCESTNFTSDILQDFNQTNQTDTFVLSSSPIIIDLEEESESKSDYQTTQPKKSWNITKNILKAFRSFFNNLAEKATIQGILEENSTCKPATAVESLKKQLNNSFETNKMNNKFIIYLIQHCEFSSVFQFFLSHRASLWIQESKLSDKEAHLESLDLIKKTLLSSGDLSKIKVNQFRKKRKFLPVSAPVV